jgi:hypothetical protein
MLILYYLLKNDKTGGRLKDASFRRRNSCISDGYLQLTGAGMKPVGAVESCFPESETDTDAHTPPRPPTGADAETEIDPWRDLSFMLFLP